MDDKSLGAQHPESSFSIRTGVRLDAETRQKVDDLARRVHQPRAAVLSYIMHWGLSRGETLTRDQGESHGPVRYLYCYMESALHARVEKAAAAAGVKTAPWIRHMVRQVTITDFPASWQEERSEERAHDSRHYGRRFMIRFDDPTWEKLEDLSTHLDKSAAEIIRQLVAQAKPEDFPQAWQTVGGPRRTRPRREASTRRRQP
jgi:predicted transcriptional regulator